MAIFKHFEVKREEEEKKWRALFPPQEKSGVIRAIMT